MSKKDFPALSENSDLDAIDQLRERERKKRSWWQLLLPIHAADLRSYLNLLPFVKPYRFKLILSVLCAALAALLLGSQIAILEQGLGSIFGGSKREIAECPECAESVVVQKKSEPSSLDRLLRGLGFANDQESPAEPADTTPAKQEPPSPPEDGKRRDFELLPLDPQAHDHSHLVVEAQSDRTLYLVALMLILAVILEAVLSYNQAVLMATASRSVIMDLRLAVFTHVMGMSTRFHQKNHSATLVSRVTHDLTLFSRFLTTVLIRVIRELFNFIVLVAVIVVKQGSFLFVVMGILAIGLLPIQLSARRLRKMNKQSQAGMADIYTSLTESITSQRVVKAFGAEQKEYSRFQNVNRIHLKKMLRVRRLRALTESMVPIIAAVGTGAVIVVGGRRVMAGTMNPETFMVVVIALGRAMTAMRNISKQLNQFHIGLSAADRIMTLLKVAPEVTEPENAVELPDFRNEIEYRNVSFSHDSNSGRDATLSNVNLTIHRGETVALVGPSGAGKSTITDLLPRFFDPDEGEILIDGVDTRTCTFVSLRGQIGIVTQETLLFRDSVADNIAYGTPGATQEQIEQAAKDANAHQFILRMPEGYATELGEKGHRLSGGERQRVAIARALLRNPPILILDEATSALDSESEAIVQQALLRLMENRTVIVIAHRLSTVRNADRIVVLERGKIVEQGTHDELMSQNGAYRKLYEIQLRGMQEAG